LREAPASAGASQLTAALPKEGPFDGNRRLVVPPRFLAPNQKGVELRRWRVSEMQLLETRNVLIATTKPLRRRLFFGYLLECDWAAAQRAAQRRRGAPAPPPQRFSGFERARRQG
jgi:hypothetical protein